MHDPTAADDIASALRALEAAGLGLGADWERAHALAQEHEGEAAYDRLHAFLHRVEGDLGNAAYWYRRAGESPVTGSLAEECRGLIARFGG